MRAHSHPDADSELEKATLFYEQRSRGLGYDFLDEFERTLSRILENPTRSRFIRGNARQSRLKRFPYAIVYEVRDDDVHVIAVRHFRRRPFYWQYRVEE